MLETEKELERNMWRTLLLGILLPLLPVASSAQPWDDGGTHDVDQFVPSSSAFVRDSTGGMPTTVNFIAGGEVPQIQVEDSSVLNFFAGSMATAQANYLETSDGTICGGEFTVLDVAGSATVEVNGGDFASIGATVRFGFGFTGGKLTIQGGRFENTSTGGDNTVLLLGTDSESEIRGGTFVDGDITMGNATLLTITGGNFNALEGLVNFGGGGATLTIVGTSFSELFGSLAPGALFNGPLSGTLADGSPFAVDLLKHSASNVLLVFGTQGPLSSALCGAVPTNIVPGLPGWAIGLVLMALAASGAVLMRRLHPAA